MQEKADIGMIGMAVMGENLSFNMDTTGAEMRGCRRTCFRRSATFSALTNTNE